MRKIDTLVVDKTGTLTEGRPKLMSVITVKMEEHQLLRFAASLERGSEHPLAEAIVSGAEERGIVLTVSEGFESMTGKGVTGRIEGHLVALGNQVLFDESGISTETLTEQAEDLRAEGQTVMYVAIDEKVAGLIGVADPIKVTTQEAINRLHDSGLRIVMLTGDNQTTAEAVAKKLGIDHLVAEVLPDQKAAGSAERGCYRRPQPTNCRRNPHTGRYVIQINPVKIETSSLSNSGRSLSVVIPIFFGNAI